MAAAIQGTHNSSHISAKQACGQMVPCLATRRACHSAVKSQNAELDNQAHVSTCCSTPLDRQRLPPAPHRQRRRPSHRRKSRLAAAAAPGAAARWRSARQLPRKLPAHLRAAATGGPRRLDPPGSRRNVRRLLNRQHGLSSKSKL